MRQRARKGAVWVDAMGQALVCAGAYWGWPWWKRALARLAHRPYAHWCGCRSAWWWLRHPRERSPRGNLRMYYAIGKSLASSRIVPISWETRLRKDGTP